MEGLSEHTLLINKVIGLTRKISHWPSILRDLGYNVDLIGATYLNKDGRETTPDLTLTSNRQLHILLVECKGGKTVNEDQLERYTKLTEESIRDKVSVYDPRRITFDICYITTDKHYEYVLFQINKIYAFPLLIFSKTSISKRNNFQNAVLNREFSRDIKINGKTPISFYPFDENDDPALIAVYVFREIVAQALRHSTDDYEIDLEEILSTVHPLWKYFSHNKKTALLRKVNSILLDYQRKELKNHIRKVKRTRKWRATKSLQALANVCQKLIDELEQQKKLFDYAMGDGDG